MIIGYLDPLGVGYIVALSRVQGLRSVGQANEFGGMREHQKPERLPEVKRRAHNGRSGQDPKNLKDPSWLSRNRVRISHT